MKKIYIIPQSSVLYAQPASLLQGSNNDFNTSGETPGTSGNDDPPVGPMNAPSIWDDSSFDQ